jgi:ubiquinone/menaquinone biosynthesis C-methylase UbiE
MTAEAARSLRERTYDLQRDELADRVFALIQANSAVPLKKLRIADIGCGRGHWLHKFSQKGVPQDDLFGIDLNLARIRIAQGTTPSALVIRADCRAAPFRDAAFDLVTQFTLFSSLTKVECRRIAAQEMLRLVKPRGLIIWYDFFVPNPMNRATRPVQSEELHELFPNCAISLERITLVAPIARLLSRFSWRAATALARMPYLRTHYLGVISKQRSRGFLP